MHISVKRTFSLNIKRSKIRYVNFSVSIENSWHPYNNFIILSTPNNVSSFKHKLIGAHLNFIFVFQNKLYIVIYLIKDFRFEFYLLPLIYLINLCWTTFIRIETKKQKDLKKLLSFVNADIDFSLFYNMKLSYMRNRDLLIDHCILCTWIVISNCLVNKIV